MDSRSNISNKTHLPIASITNSLCGGVMLLLSITGFIVYVLFIVVVFTRMKFKNSSYFIIAGWLGIADCISLVITFSYTAPAVVFNYTLTRNPTAGGILNIAWFSSLPLILFLAINRYLCICHTDLCKKLYTRTSSKYYSLSCWCFGIGYSVASFLNCCPLYFDEVLMTWSWDMMNDGAMFLSYGELIMVLIVTLGSFGLNGLVIR